jgi:cytochrome c
MTFAGLSRGQQRADVIDFLNTLSDSPMPMPKAAANAPAPAAAGGAPKAGAAPVAAPPAHK